MTNILRYALRNISPETISDLQQKYPNASVVINLSDVPAQGGMSEAEFWKYIKLLDWERLGDDAAVIEPLVARLAESALRQIYDFKDILSQKLHALDGIQYANAIGYNTPGSTFSEHSFLFARCCVVANGEAFFYAVLDHPETMPGDLDFPAILRVANEAHKRKMGTTLQYVAAYPIETFSNKQAWKA